ncbi:MAG: LacI family transcriptional regulator [Fimbriimonadaceae bacterium]|nr:LacI family DNA-binding transcriptional regulator [Chthonomonadaceae bacterium]MCO5295353.1 LacI family transcriptional regulator [Fimbriimonadaceae bacterium]
MTQEQIARIAKVSQSTVSRVLAGDERVEPRIRDRVAAVMLEHNYRPDVRARSLRNKTTGMVGLVVKRPHGGLSDDPFFANLLAALVGVLSENGRHLCVDLVQSASGQEAVYDEMLRSRRVDGLILVEPEAKDERIHRLQREGFPFVLIGNPDDAGKLWSVDNDNVAAGALAAQHLLDRGYRRIAMLAGPEGVSVSSDRIEGYRSTLRRAGLHPRVWHSEFGCEAAASVAAEALRDPMAVDSLVVLDDFMAMGAIQAARSLGRSLPGQLGLVSFNDSRLCDLLECGLSSVSLNLEKLVGAACARLLSIIDGRDPEGPRRLLVPCELHVRGSSAGPLEATG